MSALVPFLAPHSAELAELAELANDYARRAIAPSTERTYRAQWSAFADWCDAHGFAPLPAPAQVVALYVVALAREGLSASTLDVALGAISHVHELAGLPCPRASPVVRLQRSGIRRTLGTEHREAAALLVEELRRLVAPMRRRVVDQRDRALLLVGFAAALRRGELVALDLADVRETSAGVELCLHRSKGDQEGRGCVIALPHGEHPETCPALAVRRWIELRAASAGPLFVGVRYGEQTGLRLDAGDVARILKRRAVAAGLDPRQLSGHSLRAGLATAAALAGKAPQDIQRHLRHRSLEQTMRYVRRARAFVDNVTVGIGL